jgi:zinc ribbon protein
MALLKCAECGNDISDKAATCPKCGAPQTTVATSPVAPPAAKERRKTHPITWVVFFALVGAVFWFTMKSQHEATLPSMPVAVQFRPALLGPGLVLMFENKSGNAISFIATLQHLGLNDEKRLEVYVAPRSTTSIGSKEGWIGQRGDQIKLENSNFKPWTGSIP